MVAHRKESAIQREIVEAIGCEPGVIVLRNNRGTAVFSDEKTGRPRFVEYGLDKGAPDLIVFLAPGRVFGIEVKRPGEVPKPDQEACAARWKLGADVRVYIAMSANDARIALDQERARA